MNRAVFAALCAASLGTLGSAQTFKFEFLGVAEGRAIKAKLNGTESGPFHAGFIRWNFRDVGTNAVVQSNEYTLCGDFTTLVTNPQTMTLNINGGSAATLVASSFDAVRGMSGGDAKNDRAAGLQLAVWNAIYDTDFDINAGTFEVTDASSAVRAEANSYLQLLQNNALAPQSALLWGQTAGGGGQAQYQPVPEPGTLAALAIGALALARRRRKSA